MKTSEKCYGTAMFIILMVAVLADSPNFQLWTAIAVLGIIGAGALIKWAMSLERRGK